MAKQYPNSFFTVYENIQFNYLVEMADNDLNLPAMTAIKWRLNPLGDRDESAAILTKDLISGISVVNFPSHLDENRGSVNKIQITATGADMADLGGDEFIDYYHETFVTDASAISRVVDSGTLRVFAASNV